MRSVLIPALLTTAALSAVPGRPVAAQATWVGPQSPCELKPGHFLVNGAMMHLTVAVESPEKGAEHRLELAYENLVKAIQDNHQGGNPAAWYYLGRYYVLRDDLRGADSAFRKTVALDPQCADEVRKYEGKLAEAVRAVALRTWQEKQLDSARMLFRLLAQTDTADAEPRFFLGMMYTNAGQLDSARFWIEQGTAVASGREEYDQRQRQALLDLAQAYEAPAYQSPAMQDIVQARAARDSLQRAIVKDSTVLADLIAQWSGKQLRPDVHQAVARDSTTLADRLAAGRAALPQQVQRMARDSTTLAESIAPAMDVYREYLTLYPKDAEVLLRAFRRAATVGWTATADSLVNRIADQTDITTTEITRAATSVFNEGQADIAVRLLQLADRRNPYMQSTLYVLCRAYYSLQDGQQLLDVARRYAELEPLNQQALRMVAAGFDLLGERDSVPVYVARADTGLHWSVTVAQFMPSESAAVVNGMVANLTGRMLPKTTLAFQFLDASGTVVATTTVDVPPIEPHMRVPLSARVEPGTGIEGWRYSRR